MRQSQSLIKSLNKRVIKYLKITEEEIGNWRYYRQKEYSPVTDWEQAGELIDKFNISIIRLSKNWGAYQLKTRLVFHGETPLIAAMHCYVASKLGNEVDIPKELM